MNKQTPPTQNYILATVAFSILAGAGYGYGLKLPYALVTLTILLGLRSRITHFAFTSILAITSAAYYPVAINFGNPDLNVMLAANYTDPGEAAEFIASIPVQDWLFSIAVLVAGIATIVYRTQCRPAKSRVYTLVAIAACLMSPAYHLLDGVHSAVKAIHYPPVRFAVEAQSSFKRIRDDKELFEVKTAEPSTWAPVVAAGGPETIVMVIGESARRDFMSAYGFEINNTPWMASAPGKLFTNYISAGPSTVISLVHTLYGRDAEGDRFIRGSYLEKSTIQYNNSVVRLLSRAGYKTEWISNQRFFGENDSPISLAGQHSDRYYFAKRGEPGDEKKKDTLLLPHIAIALGRHERKAVFIHLNGSHPNACERTGGQYDRFYRNHELSCYVQSIRNTDALLETIHQQLKAAGGSWALIYFSDHGLRTIDKDTDSERLAHSDKVKEDYEVPLFVATSDDREHQIINAPRSGFEMLAIVTQLARITEPHVPSECDLLSSAHCHDERHVLDNDGYESGYEWLESEKK